METEWTDGKYASYVDSIAIYIYIYIYIYTLSACAGSFKIQRSPCVMYVHVHVQTMLVAYAPLRIAYLIWANVWGRILHQKQELCTSHQPTY